MSKTQLFQDFTYGKSDCMPEHMRPPFVVARTRQFEAEDAPFREFPDYARGSPATEARLKSEAREATAVGDLNSDVMGSGARKNEGKTPYSLVPVKVMAETLMRTDPESTAARAMFFAGCYQTSHDVTMLYAICETLGLDGWKDCARVFEYGMKKYKAWNWAKGMAWTVPLECLVRHLLAMQAEGVDSVDDESLLPHRGHVFCNVAMLVSYSKTYPEGNDLPPVGLLA